MFTQFEKDFLVYINSNHDNFTEKDVKRLIRAFSNKVIGSILDEVSQTMSNMAETGLSTGAFA